MNKENPIAELELDKYNQEIKIVTWVEERFNTSKLKDIDKWIKERASAFSGHGIEMLKKHKEIRSLSDYLDKEFDLSLSDTLWVNNSTLSIKWKDINPYRNNLGMFASNLLMYEDSSVIYLGIPSLEFRTCGSFDKTWKEINGDLYLIKYGTKDGNEIYSEVIACQVMKWLGLKNYVKYSIPSGRDYTICKCFTSEKYGYTPICDTIYRDYELNDLIQVYKDLGNEEEFREMLLVDSLTCNVDRHTGNFGFMSDNDTCEFVRIAPIFDNNLAFFPQTILSDERSIAKKVKYSHSVVGRLLFIELGRAVLNVSLFERINKVLLDTGEFKIDHREVIGMPKERIRFLEKLVNYQLKMILK